MQEARESEIIGDGVKVLRRIRFWDHLPDLAILRATEYVSPQAVSRAILYCASRRFLGHYEHSGIADKAESPMWLVEAESGDFSRNLVDYSC